jgi:hypothetical protein
MALRRHSLTDLAESQGSRAPAPLPWRADARALRNGQDNAITWHLIHVLEQLENGT